MLKLTAETVVLHDATTNHQPIDTCTIQITKNDTFTHIHARQR